MLPRRGSMPRPRAPAKPVAAAARADAAWRGRQLRRGRRRRARPLTDGARAGRHRADRQRDGPGVVRQGRRHPGRHAARKSSVGGGGGSDAFDPSVEWGRFPRDAFCGLAASRKTARTASSTARARSRVSCTRPACSRARFRISILRPSTDGFTGAAGSTDIDTDDDRTAGDLRAVFDAMGGRDPTGDAATLRGANPGGTDFALSRGEPLLVFRDTLALGPCRSQRPGKRRGVRPLG